MLASYSLLVVLGPAALVVAALLPKSVRAVRSAAFFALAVAALAAVIAAIAGPAQSELLGANGLGFRITIDTLSVVMLVLVSFIGAVIANYSVNYLAGDPGHDRFMRWLALTLASVLFLIMAGNVVQFAVAWVATSLSLHRLLIFYPERPAAQLAARKKFVASRLGDLFLLIAMVLLYRVFGSLDHAALASGATALKATGTIPWEVTAAAFCLIGTAILKSAQFPFHGWLIEVMETPTPVSALLHAGVINAGGFLVLRFADVITASSPALHTLAIIGGATALFGSLVMLTQTSVKVSLAYSTIGQMGFMMLECGLGAFSAALLHIVAHSLYKAHAFLSSGSVIDIARASWTQAKGIRPSLSTSIIGIAAVLGLTGGIGTAFGITLWSNPAVFALGCILTLGLAQLFAYALTETRSAYVLGRTVLACVAVAAVYFGLQEAFAWLMAGVLPPSHTMTGLTDAVIATVVIVSFAAVTVLQIAAARELKGPAWQAFYVHLANGFYVNTFTNRLALRLWPSAPPKAATPSYIAAASSQGAN
jgi:NAD(P)H-quinone oxidoreductase subunit 5